MTVALTIFFFLQNQKLKANINKITKLLETEISTSNALFAQLGEALTIDMLTEGIRLKPLQVLVCAYNSESLFLRLHFESNEVWSGDRWLSISRSHLFQITRDGRYAQWRHVPNCFDILVTDRINDEVVLIVKPGLVTDTPLLKSGESGIPSVSTILAV